MAQRVALRMVLRSAALPASWMCERGVVLYETSVSAPYLGNERPDCAGDDGPKQHHTGPRIPLVFEDAWPFNRRAASTETRR
jgi:hypothetical protein